MCSVSLSISPLAWCYCAIVHGTPLTGISIFGLCKISFSVRLGGAGGAQELNMFPRCVFHLCDSFRKCLRALMASSDCTGPLECSIARPTDSSSCSSWACWPCASSSSPRSSSLSAKNFFHAALCDVGNKFNMISWWACVNFKSGASVLI